MKNKNRTIEKKTIDDTQYAILNARRDNYNTLIWSTPMITLTALSFLFIHIFSPETKKFDLLILSTLAFFVSIFSMQLLSKHRFFERNIAQILEQYEKYQGKFLINSKFTKSRKNKSAIKISSFKLCLGLLLCFSLGSLYKIVYALYCILNTN